MALLFQGTIDTFTKAHFGKLEKDYITPQEWERLHKIKEFLQPFKRATLETQGHKATIDSVLPTIDILLKWFKMSLI